MKLPKKLPWLWIAAVLVILVVVFWFWWNPQTIKNKWDGDYYVTYFGRCTKSNGETYTVDAEKFIEVWHNSIQEVDGMGKVISSTDIDANGKATVVLNIPGGGQETSWLTFTRAADGDYYSVSESWENTAGCHGTGTGEQINKYPSLQNQ